MFNRRTILNIAFVAVILLGGLWVYGYIANPAPTGVSSSSDATGELAFSYQTNEEFSEFLKKITGIKLNFTLLEKIDNDLQNFSQPLPEIATSRPNPFAPVGSDIRESAPTGEGLDDLDGLENSTSSTSNFFEILQGSSQNQPTVPAPTTGTSTPASGSTATSSPSSATSVPAGI